MQQPEPRVLFLYSPSLNSQNRKGFYPYTPLPFREGAGG
jgi:hypothetical protein